MEVLVIAALVFFVIFLVVLVHGVRKGTITGIGDCGRHIEHKRGKKNAR